LHLAYLALGFGPGDVGVTSAITFVATANAFLYAGGDAVVADVEPESGLISIPALSAVVDELVARRTPPSILAPVDLTGAPADRAAVARLAEKCGAAVVVDAAHSLGAHYEVDGESFRVGCCMHAAAEILSFHPV